MAIFKNKINVKGMEIKNVEDFRKSSPQLLRISPECKYSMDKPDLKTDEEIQRHLEMAFYLGYKIYDYPLVDRTPIISNKIDNKIQTILEKHLSKGKFDVNKVKDVERLLKDLKPLFLEK